MTTMTKAYVVECTCGHDVTVDAEDRAEAVAKAKKLMDKDGIESHFKRYHPGETIPSVAEMHAHIEQDLHEALGEMEEMME